MTLAYLYFAFSGVINAVVSIVLGFFIFLRDRHNKANRSFALFCASIAAWSCPYVLWPMAKTAEETLRSFQLLHIGACFVPIFYFQFVLNWLDLYKEKRWILYFGYVTSTFFAFFVFSPLFIRDVVPKFSMLYWAEPGIMYHFFLINFFSFFFYSTYLLYKRYKTEVGVKRTQIKFILIGMVLTFLGGSTNFFLWYNINIPPYANILASSHVIFSAYAIVRYKLLNIRVAATEGFLLMINLFLLFRFISSENINNYLVNGLVFITTLLLSFLVSSGIQKEIRRREEMGALADTLAKANVQLQELDRQKTDFLSIAAHQLRTPLSIAKGYLELLEEDAYGKVTGETKQILKNMDESNGRLVDLVDSFLDITRLEQGRTKYDFAEHDLNATVDSVVKELANRADLKGLSISWHPNPDLPKPYFDEEKIRHVIFNYIDNAIKYSDFGTIKVEAYTDKNGIGLKVKDNGIGFDKIDEASFFQKFYRGNNVKGMNVNGTGLGLFVCSKFAEAHHGKVWAHSEGLGKGSEFGFWIPLSTS